MTNVFYKLDGSIVESKTFMKGPALADGCTWELRGEKVWHEVRGKFESIDANQRTLFGYDEAEFLARQYK